MNRVESERRRVVVLGLGNLVRSDDGVGVHAALQLMKNPQLPSGVEVIDGGTQGLNLLPVIADASHIVVIDAVNTGASSGTIVRYDVCHLDALPGSPSVHQIGFADLLEGLRWLGQSPQNMVLIGVQPDETGWGADLSPAVQAALPALAETVIKQLESWENQTALVEK